MGGSLAITIREENGKEHRMNRWTNSMPDFITNIDLLQNDPKHLNSYLKTWYDFVEDWEKNGAVYLKTGKGKFRHNMTSVYAQHPYLAPSEYGQVVVDFKTKKILHAQGYSDFGKIARVSASLELHCQSELKFNPDGSFFVEDKEPNDDTFWRRDPEYGASVACRLREFYEAGRIQEIYVWNEEDSRLLTKIEDIKDSKQLLEYLKKSHENDDGSYLPDHYSNFRIDMSPFEVIRFQESEQGFRDMKKAILDLGFVLSDTENELWEEFIKDRFQEDENEGEEKE